MNNEELVSVQEDNKIDLIDIARYLLSKIVIIVLVTIVFAMGAFGYTKLFVSPIYKSSSMFFITSKSTSISSIADIQLGTTLTKDYFVLIKSRPVVEATIEKLNLNMSYEAFASKITMDTPGNSRIISITVTDGNPEMAKKMVDALTSVTIKQISKIMEINEPSLLEKGTVPTYPISPNINSNAMKGGLAGFVLICLIFIIMYMLNDTIKTPDDIEKYLGLTNLGIIPEEKRNRSEKL